MSAVKWLARGLAVRALRLLFELRHGRGNQSTFVLYLVFVQEYFSSELLAAFGALKRLASCLDEEVSDLVTRSFEHFATVEEGTT